MANPLHVEWLREGVESWNARRERTPFTPDLSNLDFYEICSENQEYSAFGSAATYSIRVQHIDLDGINLSEANLRGSHIAGLHVLEADFSKADLEEANLRLSTLSESTFSSANLALADLGLTSMRYCDLRGARFANTNVRGADLAYANVASTISEEHEHIPTNIRGMKFLYPDQFVSLDGDEYTLFHTRFERPQSWEVVETGELIETALTTPIVKASSVDINISDQGIDAFVQQDHAISDGDLGFICRQKLDALKENTRDIANNVSNKLGENTRADLSAYHQHLRDTDPANPHRLAFLAGAIAQDMADPFVSEGFDSRLSFQLADFQRQHLDFLKTCKPEAAEAIREKAEAQLSRSVTKEEATEILDRLEASILDTEAAMESMVDVLRQMREVDDNLNAFALKVFSERDKETLDRAVEAETKELATLGARIYWRGREALETARSVGGDFAIIATVSGQSAPEIAQKIVTSLEPLMQKLAQLLTVLPPL